MLSPLLSVLWTKRGHRSRKDQDIKLITEIPHLQIKLGLYFNAENSIQFADLNVNIGIYRFNKICMFGVLTCCVSSPELAEAVPID